MRLDEWVELFEAAGLLLVATVLDGVAVVTDAVERGWDALGLH